MHLYFFDFVKEINLRNAEIKYKTRGYIRHIAKLIIESLKNAI